MSKHTASFNLTRQLNKAVDKFLLMFNGKNYDEIDGELLDKSGLYRILIRRFLQEQTGAVIEEPLSPEEKAAEEMYENLLFPEEGDE